MKAFRPTCRLAALVVLLAAAQWQCAKKPTSPAGNNDIPGQPFGLTVSTGDRQIELSWTIDNPAEVRNYYIYRRDTTISTTFVRIDSSRVTKYVDTLVDNGVPYAYQVSAVSRSNAIGPRSATVVGVPNIFSIRIAGGADYTSSQQVAIDINVPANTTFMLLGNDTSFTGSTWQPFDTPVQWLLTSGDGLKTVYAKFRDSNLNETRTRSSDAITLDIGAQIETVTESTNGVQKKAGDIIHFVLQANEPGGKASVTVDGIAQAIPLFDDGSAGDALASNGVYEVDYRVPDDAEISQARVHGNFTDRAGNVALSKDANTRITIVKAPASVTLFTPTLVGSQQNALRLTWSAAPEADFANYGIYRSTTPNFTPVPNLLVYGVTVKSTTNYTDADVQENVTYYYRILVYDTGGLASVSSNEVSGRIAINPPPTAVVLSQPLPQPGLDPSRQVLLSWSQNIDTDFAGYRVLRATSLPIGSTAAPLTFITNDKVTTYTDNGLTPGKEYYYCVIVFDEFGKSTPSNVVSYKTAPDTPPVKVTLSVPTLVDIRQFQLTWSKNIEADFASYRLYRSTTPGVTENQTLIAIFNDPDETGYEDSGVADRTTYYYRIFVYDLAGQVSLPSNEVSGTTP
jgi:fibronectin type 3 domain-containing protein